MNFAFMVRRRSCAVSTFARLAVAVFLFTDGATEAAAQRAQPGPPKNNFVLEVQAPNLARAEVVITGPGLTAPIKYSADSTEGAVTRGMYVPVGRQRRIAVTLIDSKGEVTAHGAVESDVAATFGTTIVITVVPTRGGDASVASLSTHSLVITRQDAASARKGAVGFRAQLFDPNGREVPVARGMLRWDVFGAQGGRFEFPPRDPGRGFFFPPPQLDQTPQLNPCVSLAGSTARRCLSVFTPTRFTGVTAGGRHSCALDSDGTAYCWGKNSYGQLGRATQTLCSVGSATIPPIVSDCSLVPLVVTGQHAFKAISAGDAHTCAIDTAGATWCWGNNAKGQLGIGGATTPSAGGPTPQKVISAAPAFVAISAGGEHTCALGSDQRLYCWGKASCGQLGQSILPANAPRQVSPTLTFKALSAGDEHNCAIATTGDVMCWGRGDSGQLGFTGNINPFACGNSSTEPKVAAVLPPVTAVASIAAGGSTSCAGSATAYSPTLGSVTCWGPGGTVGLRAGAQNYSTVVKRLTLGGTVTIVDHACAVNMPGTASCWGDNRSGYIGVGGAQGQVPAPQHVVAPPTTFKEIEAGPLHTCGIDDKDQVWCWGDNSYGHLGDATQQTRTAPVLIIVPSPLPIFSGRWPRF